MKYDMKLTILTITLHWYLAFSAKYQKGKINHIFDSTFVYQNITSTRTIDPDLGALLL